MTDNLIRGKIQNPLGRGVKQGYIIFCIRYQDTICNRIQDGMHPACFNLLLAQQAAHVLRLVADQVKQFCIVNGYTDLAGSGFQQADLFQLERSTFAVHQQ